MENDAAELVTRIDAACRRMTACIEGRNVRAIKELESLIRDLAAERSKSAELEARLEASESRARALDGAARELAALRAARAKDRDEITAVLSDLKPICEGPGSA